MKLGLVFTNDWELYGDGTGDYFEIQHRPLESLSRALEDVGANLTIMAEIGQQWSHMEIADEFKWASEIVSAWDSILVSMAQRGHDVQLHLHPQWLGSRYNASGWKLNLDKWAFSSLSTEEIEDALFRGKKHLETLLSKVNPQYKCVAFRSGAYCVQPSSKIVSGLVRHGFFCDSSVTKGMNEEGICDFRQACSNFLPWFVNPAAIECRAENPSGLIEIPIYSKALWDSPVLRWKLGFYYGTWLSSLEKEWFDKNDYIINGRYPRKNRPFGRRFKLFHLVQAVLRKTTVQLDYDRLSAEVFAKMLKHVIRDARDQNVDGPDIIVPVVATGHVKNMHNAENVERILEKLYPMFRDQEIVSWTLTDAIQYWFDRLSRCSAYAKVT